MLTNEEMAEAMIEKMVEFIRLWEAHDTTAGWDGPWTDRAYFTNYQVAVIGYETVLGPVRIVHLGLDVSDELNHMQLIGVFEEDGLQHLTSEVDTMWQEVGRVDGATSEWEFTSKP